jgi:hypothetical protein
LFIKTTIKNIVVKNVAKMLVKKVEMQNVFGVAKYFISQKQKIFTKKIFVVKNVLWIFKEVEGPCEFVCFVKKNFAKKLENSSLVVERMISSPQSRSRKLSTS